MNLWWKQFTDGSVLQVPRCFRLPVWFPLSQAMMTFRNQGEYPLPSGSCGYFCPGLISILSPPLSLSLLVSYSLSLSLCLLFFLPLSLSLFVSYSLSLSMSLVLSLSLSMSLILSLSLFHSFSLILPLSLSLFNMNISISKNSYRNEMKWEYFWTLHFLSDPGDIYDYFCINRWMMCLPPHLSDPPEADGDELSEFVAANEDLATTSPSATSTSWVCHQQC